MVNPKSRRLVSMPITGTSITRYGVLTLKLSVRKAKLISMLPTTSTATCP